MKKKLAIGLLSISVLIQYSSCNQRQADQSKVLKDKIDSVYNFKPHELSDKEQQEKSKTLDVFWKFVESDTSKYLNQLRSELQANGHFPFFYYDGGTLLMSLSNNQTDKKIFSDAISKCDILDISPNYYVGMLNRLASENIDISDAALKILDDTTYSFYVPEHALYFNQGYCLTYCLLPLDPSLYIDKLITKFNETKEIEIQKSIITTIWFSNSCKGDTFLNNLDNRNTLSQRVYEYAKELISNTKIPEEAILYYKNTKQEDIIALRKSALERFSDEAISELDFVTKVWRQKYKCR